MEAQKQLPVNERCPADRFSKQARGFFERLDSHLFSGRPQVSIHVSQILNTTYREWKQALQSITMNIMFLLCCCCCMAMHLRAGTLMHSSARRKVEKKLLHVRLDLGGSCPIKQSV